MICVKQRPGFSNNRVLPNLPKKMSDTHRKLGFWVSVVKFSITIRAAVKAKTD